MGPINLGGPQVTGVLERIPLSLVRMVGPLFQGLMFPPVNRDTCTPQLQPVVRLTKSA